VAIMHSDIQIVCFLALTMEIWRKMDPYYRRHTCRMDISADISSDVQILNVEKSTPFSIN